MAERRGQVLQPVAGAAPAVEPLGVALLGYGTVGSGVGRLLVEHAEAVARHAGGPLTVERIVVRDLTRPRGDGLPAELAGRLTTDPVPAWEDPRVAIVVEVMGGLRPAFDWVAEALRRGKRVVTANKDLLATFGPDLFRLAAQHGGSLHFEGSVGGGIPLIRTLQEALVGDRVIELFGIVNGTTNFILTRMERDGLHLLEALALAQERGFAEADPTNDLAGLDSGYKLRILAAVAFGLHLPPEVVPIEGIQEISPVDLANARRLGYVLKLLAVARRVGGRVEARVHPAFVPSDHPLAAVSDEFNAVFLRTAACGELMLYGRGAGSLPTGAAVVSDIVDAALAARGRPRPVPTVRPAAPEELVRPGEMISQYYVRMQVIDRPGVLAQIAAAFGRKQVSIASVMQHGRGEPCVDLVFVTHETAHAALHDALAEIAALPDVTSVSTVVRVVDDIG